MNMKINKVKKFSRCRYCGGSQKGYMSFHSYVCFQNFKLTGLYKDERRRRKEISKKGERKDRVNEFEELIVANGRCLECGKVKHTKTRLQFCSNGCLTTYKMKKGIDLATQCVVCHEPKDENATCCSNSCKNYLIWTRKIYADEIKEIRKTQPRTLGQFTYA